MNLPPSPSNLWTERYESLRQHFLDHHRAMEQAANQSVRTISAAHVQSALDLMPWLAKL